MCFNRTFSCGLSQAIYFIPVFGKMLPNHRDKRDQEFPFAIVHVFTLSMCHVPKLGHQYGGSQIANVRSHSPVSWRTSNIAALCENVVELERENCVLWPPQPRPSPLK